MKFNFLVVLFFIFFISLASAEVTTLGTFKSGTCISLKQICSNCTYNNITSIVYPDGTQEKTNWLMTKHGTDYNYSFCSTGQLGKYIINGFGDNQEPPTVWNYELFITSTGNDKTTWMPLFLLLGAFLILGIAVYIKNAYIGFFSGSLFVVAGVYMMSYGMGFFADNYTRMISYISLGIGFMLAFVSTYEMFYEEPVTEEE